MATNSSCAQLAKSYFGDNSTSRTDIGESLMSTPIFQGGNNPMVLYLYGLGTPMVWLWVTGPSCCSSYDQVVAH
jgi:hypothetical protein